VTAEEQRAVNYRLQAQRRGQAIKERAELLKGDDEQARLVRKAWKPLLPGKCGDTSLPQNKET
jgi:hypothetical protein